MNDLMKVIEALPIPGDITFCAGGKPVLIIKPDGRLERGEGFASDDEGSVAIFDVLSKSLPTWIADLRRRAESAEAALRILQAGMQVMD